MLTSSHKMIQTVTHQCSGSGEGKLIFDCGTRVTKHTCHLTNGIFLLCTYVYFKWDKLYIITLPVPASFFSHLLPIYM